MHSGLLEIPSQQADVSLSGFAYLLSLTAYARIFRVDIFCVNIYQVSISI